MERAHQARRELSIREGWVGIHVGSHGSKDEGIWMGCKENILGIAMGFR